jgi:hypothetical protein
VVINKNVVPIWGTRKRRRSRELVAQASDRQRPVFLLNRGRSPHDDPENVVPIWGTRECSHYVPAANPDDVDRSWQRTSAIRPISIAVDVHAADLRLAFASEKRTCILVEPTNGNTKPQ